MLHDDLQKLLEHSRDVVVSLSNLCDQLDKIIAAKKQLSSNNIDASMQPHQTSHALSDIANLEKIDLAVVGEINKMTQLNQRIESSLISSSHRLG